MTQIFTRFFVVLAVSLLAGAGSAWADVQSDLFAGYEKMMNGSFISDMVVTNKGKESRIEARYESMRRVHMKTPDIEFIMIPEGTWMKMNGQGWMKPPFDISGMVQSTLPKTIEDARAGISNIKDLGNQTIDGKTLRAISFDQNLTVMGKSVSSSPTVFLDGSGRIVRTESTEGSGKKQSVSYQTIRYDDSLRVQAPN